MRGKDRYKAEKRKVDKFNATQKILCEIGGRSSTSEGVILKIGLTLVIKVRNGYCGV